MIVDKDVRVVYDGDDCRWWCVLKEVLGVQLSMGMWLERCRDGSYAINALRYDVWVVCACIAMYVHCRLFHWFLGKCFLVEVHPYMTCFCTFWQSAFSVTCFGEFFWEMVTNA